MKVALEDSERVKEDRVPREPEHEPWRIGDRAELHHDETHREHDARQRHHPRGRRRQIGLGRSHGQQERIGREIHLFQTRQ